MVEVQYFLRNDNRKYQTSKWLTSCSGILQKGGPPNMHDLSEDLKNVFQQRYFSVT